MLLPHPPSLLLMVHPAWGLYSLKDPEAVARNDFILFELVKTTSEGLRVLAWDLVVFSCFFLTFVFQMSFHAVAGKKRHR